MQKMRKGNAKKTKKEMVLIYNTPRNPTDPHRGEGRS